MDLIAVALIAVFAFVGWKRGFIKTFFGLFGFLIAAGLAWFLAPYAAPLLRTYLIEPALSSYFLGRLTAETKLSAAEIDFFALPEGARELFARFGVPAEEKAKELIASGVNAGQEMAESMARAAIAHVAETLSKAVSFFLVFFLSSVFIAVLTRALDLAAKAPGLKKANRAFGLAAGIFEGLVLAFVLARILYFLQPTLRGSGIEWLSGFTVDNTYLIRLLCGWNLPAIRDI